MDNNSNKTRVIASALLAVGLTVLGLCIKSGLNSFSARDRVVDVRGLAEREVNANKVTWPIVFKEVGNDLPSVYGKVSSTNQEIIDFLKANGITDAEISTSAPEVENLQANRYSNTPVPYNYSVQSVVTVSSTKVSQVHELINRQGELLTKGIAIISSYQYRTTYEYTDLNSIKPEMIAEATTNAREAAKKFAEDSDSHIGKIKTARQGQFSIEDRDEFTPYIKKIRVVTSLTYYLED